MNIDKLYHEMESSIIDINHSLASKKKIRTARRINLKKIKNAAVLLFKLEENSKIHEAEEIYKLQRNSILIASKVQKEKNRLIELSVKEKKKNLKKK